MSDMPAAEVCILGALLSQGYTYQCLPGFEFRKKQKKITAGILLWCKLYFDDSMSDSAAPSRTDSAQLRKDKGTSDRKQKGQTETAGSRLFVQV